jgi:hypothetical protein
MPWRDGLHGLLHRKIEDGAKVNDERTWNVNELRIDESGNLVISAEPGYGNRKKWEGEMGFRLQRGQIDELLEQLNSHKAGKRMLEVAADEMREFIELFKVEYLEKKRYLAEQLNIDIGDVPTPRWYYLDSPNVPVTVDC